MSFSCRRRAFETCTQSLTQHVISYATSTLHNDKVDLHYNHQLYDLQVSPIPAATVQRHGP